MDCARLVAFWSTVARAEGSEGELSSAVAEAKNALTLSAIVPLVGATTDCTFASAVFRTSADPLRPCSLRRFPNSRGC